MDELFQPKPSVLERTERELKKMENELFREASDVVYSAVTHAFDIDVTEAGVEIPAEWLEELQDCVTEEEKTAKLRELDRRKRIATYALQSPKNAPVALQIAAKMLGGMMKAKAIEGSGPKHLNLTMVSISAPNQPVPQFPVKEVKHE
jgi:hypothetical protein